MKEGMPTRPVLRWHGGKWKLAPWIISFFPPHRVYVEPYGGGASVLVRKPRSYAEIYNDLDRDVVALFRVLRDPEQAPELIRRLELTPFARAEFEAAYFPAGDDLSLAHALVVRSLMGFGSDGHNKEVKTGFRANSNRSGSTPARDWATYPDVLRALVERLRGVVVENRPAAAVMAAHDAPDALHYVDPPYMPDTRSKKSRRGKLRYHAYSHEMTEADHRELLNFLKTLSGMVILSGYPTALYDDALIDWQRFETVAHADGARERTEVLWVNPAVTEALGHGPLFAEVS